MEPRPLTPVVPKLTKDQLRAAIGAIELRFREAGAAAERALVIEEGALPPVIEDGMGGITASVSSLYVRVRESVSDETAPETADQRAAVKRGEAIVKKCEADIVRLIERAKADYAKVCAPIRARLDRTNKAGIDGRKALATKRDRVDSRLRREKDAAILAAQFNGDAQIIGEFLQALPSARSLADLLARDGITFTKDAAKQLTASPE